MKMIYITENNGLIASQVIPILNIYKKEVSEVELVCFKKKNDEIKFNYDNTRIINSISIYPLLNLWIYWKLIKVLIIENGNEDLRIHVRAEIIGYIVLSLLKLFGKKKYKVIIDIRGAVFEELKLTMSNNFLFLLKKIILKKIKNRIWKISDKNVAFSTVSNELKKYVNNKYNIKESRIFVNHCIADSDKFKYNLTNRIQLRAKLGLKEDDVVILFMTGGNAAWQSSKKIIKHLSNLSCKIMILGIDDLGGNHKGIFFNKKIDFKDVPLYLSVADIGFIWRDDNIINNVACPVKFIEYVSAGLPIISNGAVKIIKEYIDETKFGKIIMEWNELNNIDFKKLKRSVNREEIMKYSEKFSPKIIGQSYIDMFNIKKIKDNK